MIDMLANLIWLLIVGVFSWKISKDFRRDVDAYWGPEAFESEPREAARAPVE